MLCMSQQPLTADVALPWTAGPAAFPTCWEGKTGLFDLGLRPEAIGVREIDGRTESNSAGTSVIAQVRRLEFNGPEVLATLTSGPHRVIARLPASQRI
jgi:hypothetical protein